MKNILLTSLLGCFTLQGFAQNFPVVDIVQNGPLTNRVNVAILPDGYTSSVLDTFIVNADSISETMFHTAPFKHYKNFFNVVAIKVPSVDVGADHLGTAVDVIEPLFPLSDVNTYFDCKFDVGGLHRCVAPYYLDSVYSVLGQNYPSYDLTLMLSNTQYYGGGGMPDIAICTRYPTSVQIAMHEIGHSFADLRDEYWPGSFLVAEVANMTQESDPNQVVWHNWIGTNNVGVFPHGLIGDAALWYKPHESCKMKVLTSEFCSVCQEAFIETIYGLVSPIDNALPDTMVAVNYSSTPLQFTLNLIKPEPFSLKVKWELNGNMLTGTDTTIQITGGQLNNGTNHLRAYVIDTTILARSYWPDAGYQFYANWTINNGPTGIAEITGGDKKEKFFYKVYPMPAKNKITLDYNNQTSDNLLSYNIFDVTGRIVYSGTIEMEKGEQKRLINLPDMASGLYMINFKGATVNIDTKLVIQ